MKAPSPISVRSLIEAVVVAEDRAGADVGLGADAAVAEVGQVVGLGASVQSYVLNLDEIADVHVGAELGARPEAREGSDPRPFADNGACEMAEA